MLLPRCRSVTSQTYTYEGWQAAVLVLLYAVRIMLTGYSCCQSQLVTNSQLQWLMARSAGLKLLQLQYSIVHINLLKDKKQHKTI